MENKKYKFINRDLLKLLALFFMLLDHLWATVIPGNQWLNYIGRLAFPIFAFQIVEGFVHTSNFKRYALRLFIFALISEIPFNLFYSSSIIYPFYQNVMFTLLLGLLAIRYIDPYLKEKTNKNLLLAFLSGLGFTLLAVLGLTDYGGLGVLTVIVFYLFRDIDFAWLYQLIALFFLNVYFFKGMYIPIELFGKSFEFQTQGFALLALIPIHLYNGEKGSGNKYFKYASYVFYPLHMLILYFIFSFLN